MNRPRRNPRYVAYARSQGRSPAAQLRHDLEEYPGGCMCGFILWIRARVREFQTLRPDCFVGDHIRDQEAFTRFCQSQPRTRAGNTYSTPAYSNH